MKSDAYYRDLDVSYSAKLERDELAREEIERFRDKARDHDHADGLCRCKAYSRPHDHEWTGDEPEDEPA